MMMIMKTTMTMTTTAFTVITAKANATIKLLMETWQAWYIFRFSNPNRRAVIVLTGQHSYEAVKVRMSYLSDEGHHALDQIARGGTHAFG